MNHFERAVVVSIFERSYYCLRENLPSGSSILTRTPQVFDPDTDMDRNRISMFLLCPIHLMAPNRLNGKE